MQNKVLTLAALDISKKVGRVTEMISHIGLIAWVISLELFTCLVFATLFFRARKMKPRALRGCLRGRYMISAYSRL